MTNLEALRANISGVHGVVLEEGHFMKALIDQGLVTDAPYTSADDINHATLKLYDIIIESAGFSEGGLSYNVNLEGVRQARELLEKRMGIYDKDIIKRGRIW